MISMVMLHLKVEQAEREVSVDLTSTELISVISLATFLAICLAVAEEADVRARDR